MKILVTGGYGFQGSHLALALARAGHDVAALGRLSPSAENTEPILRNVGVRCAWGSVTDPEVVDRAVEAHDVVVHMAARTNVDESAESPAAFLAANLTGTRVVLEAVRRSGRAMIYSSSCEVYGASAEPVGEGAEFRPASPYAGSKAAADRLCYAYARTYGTQVVIARPCNVYGPGQRGGRYGGVIPIFVEAALRGRDLTVRGSGEQSREWLHVDDVVSAYTLFLSLLTLREADGRITFGGRSGEAYNFGSGEVVSIRRLAEAVIAEVKVGRIVHVDGRPGEVAGFRLDSSKAERELGWRAQTKFADGLRRYVRWVKEARR